MPVELCPTKQHARELASQWEQELYRNSADRRSAEYRAAPTFGDCIEYYTSLHGGAPHSAVNVLQRSIGELQIDDAFPSSFVRWIETMGHSKAKRAHRGQSGIEIVSTDRTVSPSTIQTYKRYARAILSACCRPEAGRNRLQSNPLAGMSIGKAVARWRIITDAEDHRITEVVGNDYSWLLPALQFAKCNPIRNEDQFSLTQSEHFNRIKMTIEYTPHKTSGKTQNKVIARPVIFPHLEPHFKALPPQSECDHVFHRPGLRQLQQDPGRLYQIHSFKRTWASICLSAGVVGVTWYDYRHHAVKRLRSLGFPNWLIQRIAGWTSPAMLDHYDPQDAEYADRYAAELIAKAPFTKLSQNLS